MTKTTDNFLLTMASKSLERYQSSSQKINEHQLLERCETNKPNTGFRLNKDDFTFIAEIKKASPSIGELSADNFDLCHQAQNYIVGGADIISVLTEPTRFLGSLDDLSKLSKQYPNTPFMRKDFLVHPYQVSEACYSGAAGVLLIAGILSDAKLETMIKRAQQHHMFVLVEVFNKAELEQSIDVIANLNNQPNSIMLGVNCRDLKSLEVNFSWFEYLAEALPKDLICVAESGINVPNDIRKIVSWGYRGALIGTTLMQSDDPAQTLLDFRQAAITAQQAL